MSVKFTGELWKKMGLRRRTHSHAQRSARVYAPPTYLVNLVVGPEMLLLEPDLVFFRHPLLLQAEHGVEKGARAAQCERPLLVRLFQAQLFANLGAHVADRRGFVDENELLSAVHEADSHLAMPFAVVQLLSTHNVVEMERAVGKQPEEKKKKSQKKKREEKSSWLTIGPCGASIRSEAETDRGPRLPLRFSLCQTAAMRRNERGNKKKSSPPNVLAGLGNRHVASEAHSLGLPRLHHNLSRRKGQRKEKKKAFFQKKS